MLPPSSTQGMVNIDLKETEHILLSAKTIKNTGIVNCLPIFLTKEINNVAAIRFLEVTVQCQWSLAQWNYSKNH